MSLFHPRVLTKHARHIPVNSAHIDTLKQWAANIEQGIFDVETQVEDRFIQHILSDVLGYVARGDAPQWTASRAQSIGNGIVDVAIGYFAANSTQIIAPLELKGAKTNLDINTGRPETPVQQAWRYANAIEGAKWVLVSNYREIRLYAYGKGIKNYETFDLTALQTDAEQYKRFILLLSAQYLLGGKTQSLLEESEQTGKDITDKFYKEYKEFRVRLIEHLAKDNPAIDKLDIIRYAQKILDRILFVAFAESRELLPKNTLKDTHDYEGRFDTQPKWKNFVGLFGAINEGNAKLSITAYNGGLFFDDPTLNELNVNNNLCKGFRDLSDHDFNTEISVDILGHIFEQSISDLEELRAAAGNGDTVAGSRNKKSKRKTDGVFYTPPYITQYIVEQTVGGYLADRRKEIGFDALPPLADEDYEQSRNRKIAKRKASTVNDNTEKHIAAWEAYKEVLSGIKVLDPACGSGAFLIEVFDYLYREGKKINDELTRLRGYPELFRWDKNVLENNLYGVDLNRESVEITKLSLWLKTANKGEKLTYLEDNIKVGNSLIDDKAVAGDLAFDWHKEFSDIMANGGFDVVVGNPPYVDSETMMNTGLQGQREYLSEKLQYTRGNWDLYIAFLEAGFRLLNGRNNGKMSFITPDKWLVKPFGNSIREGLLSKFVFLTDCGRDVFTDALVDSIIIGLQTFDCSEITTARLEREKLSELGSISKSDIPLPYNLDWLLSGSTALIKKLQRTKTTLAEVADIVCENACATSDCYKLKPFIEDRKFETSNDLKVINTGTIGKYVSLWGISAMTYLKDKYATPVVNRSTFLKNFSNSYGQKSIKPKLIIKGLTLLDVCMDDTGHIIPGKTTIIISENNGDLMKLKAVMAFLNSKLPLAYIKEKYRGATYNQGINFTTEMLASIPCPAKFNTIVNTLAGLADSQTTAYHKLFAERERFRHLLMDNLSGVKMSDKRFDELVEFKDFLDELKKQKRPIPLSEQGEWREVFNNTKQKITMLAKTIKDTDDEIDKMVYDLYGLSPEEVAIIDGKNRAI